MIEQTIQNYLRDPDRGPRIVTIGGGTGLSTMLRGLKRYTSHICAICTVADDGGSSGMLRREIGILPPGDIRNNIMALADTEPIMEQLMNYRFTDGSLKGQNFGNLFIAAMTGVCDGNFYEAVRNFSDVLAVTGKVLPVSLSSIRITAELSDGRVLAGESVIGDEDLPEGVRITGVSMEPSGAPVLNEALDEIRSTDLVVLGPGSLYTSIIPNLLFPELVQALRDTEAPVAYVCNIMTQPAETRSFTAEDHLRTVLDYLGDPDNSGQVVNYCIINKEAIDERYLKRYMEANAEPVQPTIAELEALGVMVIADDLMEIAGGNIRHDATRLARHLARLAALELERRVSQARTRIYTGLETKQEPDQRPGQTRKQEPDQGSGQGPAHD